MSVPVIPLGPLLGLSGFLGRLSGCLSAPIESPRRSGLGRRRQQKPKSCGPAMERPESTSSRIQSAQGQRERIHDGPKQPKTFAKRPSAPKTGPGSPKMTP